MEPRRSSEPVNGETAAGRAAGRVEFGKLSDDWWRRANVWAHSAVAGRQAASATIRFAGMRGGGHEVSTLIAMDGAVGRCRGVAPRSKTSMMIMRPPQHGQVGMPGSTAAPVGSAWEFERRATRAPGRCCRRACRWPGADISYFADRLSAQKLSIQDMPARE
jgi:hypothetical protein